MNTLIRIITFLAIALSTTQSFGVTKLTDSLKIIDPQPFVVETLGSGLPVLYLPGFATPGTVWEDTVEHLNLERTSYLFSYAGFNGNKPIAMPWYATIKNAIVAYIIENKMSDVIIVGHSMGGNLAVDIAAELPSKVSKLIIVDALPCMREIMMPNVPVENLYYESPYNKQMLSMDAEQFKNMAVMMASNMTLNEAKKVEIANWLTNADRKTWVYGYTDLLKLDLRPILTQVKCETLILGASFPNVEVAQKNYEDQYGNLAKKTIIMANNSKHFLMFDQPEWFYAEVADFLADGEQ